VLRHELLLRLAGVAFLLVGPLRDFGLADSVSATLTPARISWLVL